MDNIPAEHLDKVNVVIDQVKTHYLKVCEGVTPGEYQMCVVDDNPECILFFLAEKLNKGICVGLSVGY